MEVNKYIGLLMSVLREYHSGWVLEDYVNECKEEVPREIWLRFQT